MNHDPEIVARKLEISGVVQGVGFRPFLFVLAKENGLRGQVSNTAAGVETIIEGSPASIENFVRDIRLRSPLLARVTRVVETRIPVHGFEAYKIVKSRASQGRSTLISPDVCTCDDCLAEMNNPLDPRFEYPFINCTNCGPRFTIIKEIPYDRPKTSMHDFTMCDLCRKEYENPLDRRFHAQPNACPVCGPRVFLTDPSGNRIDTGTDSPIDRAGQLLGQGHILGIKGLGGFHLAVDAANDGAVQELRKRKNRPRKPFALMARSASTLFDHVRVSEMEKKLLLSYHRPIVLLAKKDILGHAGLSPSLSFLNTCLGIMLPYTPVHFLLLDKGPDILVMTSGNRPGEPLSIDNHDALDGFSHIADYFLFHDRDIYFRADDSIVRVQAEKPRFLRRSRGYAPLPVALDRDVPHIIGCGGGMKNTVCLTRGSSAFLSQHIGDLDHHKTFEFYRQTIAHFKKILDIEPIMAVHDLHPDYPSTRYARALAREGMACEAIQHHHAHAVACMAENHVDGEVLALVLDGTGYGTDGRIWGGEILSCTHDRFERRAHLSYVHMPGGDRAVLQPWRMAASVLFRVYGRDFLNLDIPFVRDRDPKALAFLGQMMEKNINSPLTSSTGRLFDAVASLVGICHEISYESQAAMELAALAAQADEVDLDPYDMALVMNHDTAMTELNIAPGIRQMVRDLARGLDRAVIAARFHDALVLGFSRAVGQIAQETGLSRVVLSGGVFNNDRILEGMIKALEEKELRVYTHTQVPCGDGGISLGQVVAGAARMG